MWPYAGPDPKDRGTSRPETGRTYCGRECRRSRIVVDSLILVVQLSRLVAVRGATTTIVATFVIEASATTVVDDVCAGLDKANPCGSGDISVVKSDVKRNPSGKKVTFAVTLDVTPQRQITPGLRHLASSSATSNEGVRERPRCASGPPRCAGDRRLVEGAVRRGRRDEAEARTIAAAEHTERNRTNYIFTKAPTRSVIFGRS